MRNIIPLSAMAPNAYAGFRVLLLGLTDSTQRLSKYVLRGPSPLDLTNSTDDNWFCHSRKSGQGGA